MLSNYLNEYEETPWTALKYIIGNIFYGGNIIDIWDKRLLDTYINQFFNENTITALFHKYVIVFQYILNHFLHSLVIFTFFSKFKAIYKFKNPNKWVFTIVQRSHKHITM